MCEYCEDVSGSISIGDKESYVTYTSFDENVINKEARLSERLARSEDTGEWFIAVDGLRLELVPVTECPFCGRILD